MSQTMIALLCFIIAGCGATGPVVDWPAPPVPSAAPAALLVSASPLEFSRAVASEVLLTGVRLDLLSPSAVWLFPGCSVADTKLHDITTSAARLTIVPGPTAKVGDTCPLKLHQPALPEQIIAGPFTTKT